MKTRKPSKRTAERQRTAIILAWITLYDELQRLIGEVQAAPADVLTAHERNTAEYGLDKAWDGLANSRPPMPAREE